MRFIAEEVSKDTYVNIMDQYRPCFRAGNFKDISRRITKDECEEALNIAFSEGLKLIS